ncbi:hypothetical protein HK102_001601 [Quaeritorhiza haematococci]|nr:hypothetical protein HK102_001601 [Quaeritorhiza haematococci]
MSDSHWQPQTGDAALQHFNRPEHADIVLDVEGAGVFYAHRSYLTRSERFKSYGTGGSKDLFMEASAPVVKITPPIPSQFYNVLHHLYTGKLPSDWFGTDRLAETLCTADYFALEELKKEAINHFGSHWKDAMSSPFFAPKWIPLEMVSDLISSRHTTALDKLDIIGSWFSKGDDLSPQVEVYGMVSSKCQVDESLTIQAMQKLRKEWGPSIFNGVVSSSFFGDVIDRTLRPATKNHDKSYQWKRTY